jgi:phage gp29-like protein
MKTITTTAGTVIAVDGDVLAVLEAVSRDQLRQRELDYGFEDVDREFSHLVAQLDDEALKTYLKESLFMSFNRFENDQMAKIARRAARAEEAE